MMCFSNNEEALEYLKSCGYTVTKEMKTSYILENNCKSLVKVSNGRAEFMSAKVEGNINAN